MKAIVISYNANSRNRRKVVNGFKGESTPSTWTKTSSYGTYKHEHTADEKAHMNRIHQAKTTGNLNKHAGSKTGRQLYISVK